MNIESNKPVETENIFDGGDFVFTTRINENGEKEIVGGGYKINSLFLQEDIPILKTLNSGIFDLDQNGGKVSSPFENLAVPAGLFYINQRVPKNNKDNMDEYHYKKHNTISDDMIDKLFGLIEVNKKKQRKTRKHTINSSKQKTKRHIN